MSRELTPEEAKAVRALKRLSNKWPRTLKLFSWAGTLVIMDSDMEASHDAILVHDTTFDIPNDGGDP